MSFISKITRIFRKTDDAKEESKKTTPNKNKLDIRDYINKFVKQHDTDIGESVAFHDERIIVKNRDGFMAVPLSAIKDNSEKITVGDFDTDEALALGKEWYERKDTLKFDENGMMVKEETKE